MGFLQQNVAWYQVATLVSKQRICRCRNEKKTGAS